MTGRKEVKNSNSMIGTSLLYLPIYLPTITCSLKLSLFTQRKLIARARIAIQSTTSTALRRISMKTDRESA